MSKVERDRSRRDLIQNGVVEGDVYIDARPGAGVYYVYYAPSDNFGNSDRGVWRVVL